MGAEIETRIKNLIENPKVRTLWERAKQIKPVDAGHDFSHIERVARMTVEIYSKESKTRRHVATREEIDACTVAALLHDCVPVPKNSPLRKESSRLASEKAREWLVELEWAPKSINEICDAILDHSFSSGRTPRSLLGEALQDADRLEALGAIGLYRVIATGVSMGAELFNSDDPWAKSRELDDRKYSIDHFFTKLLKLPETFRTAAAKEEAKKRTDYLQGFVDQLRGEIG